MTPTEQKAHLTDLIAGYRQSLARIRERQSLYNAGNDPQGMRRGQLAKQEGELCALISVRYQELRQVERMMERGEVENG